MAASFPGVDPSQVGVYVGTIASAFALAQLATNFFWGWMSDKIGRKPVILLGTILTAVHASLPLASCVHCLKPSLFRH